MLISVKHLIIQPQQLSTLFGTNFQKLQKFRHSYFTTSLSSNRYAPSLNAVLLLFFLRCLEWALCLRFEKVMSSPSTITRLTSPFFHSIVTLLAPHNTARSGPKEDDPTHEIPLFLCPIVQNHFFAHRMCIECTPVQFHPLMRKKEKAKANTTRKRFPSATPQRSHPMATFMLDVKGC